MKKSGESPKSEFYCKKHLKLMMSAQSAEWCIGFAEMMLLALLAMMRCLPLMSHRTHHAHQSTSLPKATSFARRANIIQRNRICPVDKFGFFDGGGRWIRTIEVTDNRFTVCPLWPLGNSPKYKLRLAPQFLWSWWTESNHQPADYKSAALPLSHTSKTLNSEEVCQT